MRAFQFSTNTFAGEFDPTEIIAALLLSADTLNRNLVSVDTGVKNKLTRREADTDIELQAWNEDFVGQAGNPSDDEYTLEPVKYMYNQKWSFESLRTTWESEQMAPGTFNDYKGSPEMFNWLLNRISEKMAIAHEKLIWTGKANTPEATFPEAYPGLLNQVISASNSVKLQINNGRITITDISQAAQAVVTHASGENANVNIGDQVTFVGVVGMVEINGLSAEVVDKTATTTVVDLDTSAFTAYASGGLIEYINSSNFLSVLNNLWVRTPRAVKKRDDFKIYAPAYLEDQLDTIYINAASQVGASAFMQDVINKIMGKVEWMEYFQPNTMLSTYVNNLSYAIDGEGEDQNLQILDMYATLGNKNYRVMTDIKSTTGVKKPYECVMIRPAA
ncbi:MAG: ubiquitin-activating E1 FCCH domain-containing protein [Thermonemataceae bacterium]